MEQFPYTSIQDYLEKVFSQWENTPSDQEIKIAKATYRKIYNNSLKRYRRKVLRYVSISYSQAQFETVKTMANQQDVSIYDLIRNASLRQSPFVFPSQQIKKIEVGLMQLLESIQEALDEPSQILMEQIMQQAHELEKSILKITETNNNNDY